jgi:hypothetical protein
MNLPRKGSFFKIVIEEESIGEWFRSSQILYAIPSPNFLALWNSACPSFLSAVDLCHTKATPIDPTELKQSSRPISSASLQVWFGKAKSSDVAQSIPHCSLFFAFMHLWHNGNSDACVNIS